MHELDQLERQHEAFARRNVRIVAVSVDDRPETAQTQERFPHLTILSDPQGKTVTAFQSMHPGQGPGGEDVAAPTTFVTDGAGTIRYFFRPERFIVRQTPEELLAAIDQHLPTR